mgnify:CR=1 FL=1
MLLGFYYPKRYHGGKTMKRTVSFALSAVLALAMLLFIGCKGNETQPKQADVEAVYTKLVESGQLPSMTKVPRGILKRFTESIKQSLRSGQCTCQKTMRSQSAKFRF